ncbi:MAG: TetR/AcrR family transcriptional regulator [Paracoccus sp. (in: a-proteobacteria)]|nr:TetR/AcrR family transcriptional regulator [Paracoccus sp. (in: a-proteobacteria)]
MTNQQGETASPPALSEQGARRAQAQPRRTQAERSAATRTGVCEATLDALVEVGYERISTTLIAQKANVSRGALTHQFPTRNDLMAAAFQYLVDSWGGRYPLGATFDPPQMSAEDMADALWTAIFSTPRYIAAIEMMLAARQDNELGGRLRQINDAWIARRDCRVVEILGGSLDNDRDATFVQLMLAVLRGIAVHKSLDSSDDMALRLLRMWKQITRQIDIAGLAREQ